MDRFLLEINIVNDELLNDPDPGVARLLREAADRVEQGDAWRELVLRDVNGNQVGTFGYIPEGQ